MSSERKYLPGTLVHARSRDWVVLPPDEPDVVRLRPVDGSDAEAVGIYLPLEPEAIRPSEYQPPNPKLAGDFTGASLLRDAVRLSLRSGAGPFRSMGRLSFVSRPYQFVPLIMALRLDPVRLLIADDAGVGKTIEAAMIAPEMLDRGVVRRIRVLCAPHLCEQWEEVAGVKPTLESFCHRLMNEESIVGPERLAALFVRYFGVSGRPTLSELKGLMERAGFGKVSAGPLEDLKGIHFGAPRGECEIYYREALWDGAQGYTVLHEACEIIHETLYYLQTGSLP